MLGQLNSTYNTLDAKNKVQVGFMKPYKCMVS